MGYILTVSGGREIMLDLTLRVVVLGCVGSVGFNGSCRVGLDLTLRGQKKAPAAGCFIYLTVACT